MGALAVVVTAELKLAFAGHRGNCRSCGARVCWVVTERGKKMPLNYVPVERTESGRGLFAIRLLDSGDLEAIAVTAAWLDEEDPVFTSHFATCPNAKRHRRRG